MLAIADTLNREAIISRFRHGGGRRQFRTNTIVELHAAVERVITTMHARLTEPLTLEELACIANFSPYYFTRVFRNFTGLPPAEYLYALRIQAAKELLITSDLSVTDICFEVGYNSLGTFSTRFTKLVGVSPRQLRNLTSAESPTLGALGDNAHGDAPLSCYSLSGRVTAACPGPFFIGLFAKPIPEGQPLSCTMVSEPGHYHMPIPHDGCYYLAAMGLTTTSRSMANLLLESASYHISVSPKPLRVHHHQIYGSTDITLRQVNLLDPPLLTILPILNGMQRALSN